MNTMWGFMEILIPSKHPMAGLSIFAINTGTKAHCHLAFASALSPDCSSPIHCDNYPALKCRAIFIRSAGARRTHFAIAMSSVSSRLCGVFSAASIWAAPTASGTNGAERFSGAVSLVLWNFTLTILLMPCSSIVTP